ncbi:hypothetical protein G7Y89_g8983 [Cudoniella acicularis]|uniref:Cytochrome P450 n=1 Tax=Cudoniella acicularis TaxID=354080 RepID=A0A8H4RFI9_9HELO|nr:hypothetical protein G7Y89_g8983 [Cudoniella acicularis]
MRVARWNVREQDDDDLVSLDDDLPPHPPPLSTKSEDSSESTDNSQNDHPSKLPKKFQLPSSKCVEDIISDRTIPDIPAGHYTIWVKAGSTSHLIWAIPVTLDLFMSGLAAHHEWWPKVQAFRQSILVPNGDSKADLVSKLPEKMISMIENQMKQKSKLTGVAEVQKHRQSLEGQTISQRIKIMEPKRREFAEQLHLGKGPIDGPAILDALDAKNYMYSKFSLAIAPGLEQDVAPVEQHHMAHLQPHEHDPAEIDQFFCKHNHYDTVSDQTVTVVDLEYMKLTEEKILMLNHVITEMDLEVMVDFEHPTGKYKLVGLFSLSSKPRYISDEESWELDEERRNTVSKPDLDIIDFYGGRGICADGKTDTVEDLVSKMNEHLKAGGEGIATKDGVNFPKYCEILAWDWDPLPPVPDSGDRESEGESDDQEPEDIPLPPSDDSDLDESGDEEPQSQGGGFKSVENMLILSIPVLGLTVLSFFIFYKFILYPTFISPLSKIPNAHWSASFSPLWILWTRYTNYENRSLHAAHQQHGAVIRVAPNELSINDINGLRIIYAGGFEKGQWYSIFDNYGVPCMFSSWHSRPHSARKRMISNIYSKSNLQSSPAFARQAQVILYDRLLPAITSASTLQKSQNGIDVLDLWNATTLDFITAYLFGLKNGSNFLQNEPYRCHWMSLYHSRKTHTFFPQELPRLTRFFKILGIHLVPTWVDDANQELEAWCKDRCDATSAYLAGTANNDPEIGNEPVVMNALLSGISKEEKSKGSDSVLSTETLKYPELSIASEMIDHLAAGHETAGITLTYLAWHLSQNLHLQDALRKELLTPSPNMDLSYHDQASSKRSIPNAKELDALPLLHAVLMETLRLDAAIPGGQPRMTPFPSCTLSPFTDIPGGVRVGAQAYSVHRNETVYPSPGTWDYTRWMDEQNGTHIADDEGIEQTDGYTCGPAGNKLVLRFERVGA